MHPRKLLSLAACTLLTLSLAACGGGGGGGGSFPIIAPTGPSTQGSSDTPPTYRISGTAAYGHPVAGQTVQVQDAKGQVCASTTTGSDGSYSVDTTACAAGSAAVYLASYTTPAGAPLDAVAIPPQGTTVINGVVNIDPLTTLLAYAAAGLVVDTTAPADNARVLALLSKVTATQYQQAKTSVLIAPLLQVLQSLYGIGSNGFDPTNSPFTADGQGLDAFFDAYLLTATPTSVQLQAPGSLGPLVRVTLPATAAGGSTVTSTTAYNIGGTVAGLSVPGDSLTLLLNGGNAFTVNANGHFTFPTPVASSYAVTVGTQPAGKTCTVSNGSGTGITASVSNIGVTCSAITYTVGGSVAGLSGTLTLQNNGADAKTVSANGSFGFATPVAWHGSSNVTVSAQPAGQTCTVTNGVQSNLAANVSNVSVTCATNTYTIGGTVSGLTGTLTLQNNGADSSVLNANGAFTFATPVAWSSSYNVTVNTQPVGQTCTVSNGSGANVVANVTNVSVMCASTPHPAYVYMPDYGGNQVLGYRIDTVTGAFSSIPGSPFPAGLNDRWVTTNPAGTFAYATNQSGNSISAYSIDPSTGTLTAVPGSPFATGVQPSAMVVNAAGTLAFVANSGDNTVSVYGINAVSGALAPVPGSPFPTGSAPIRVAVNPAGTFAYVANTGDGTVSAYGIDPVSGALSAVPGSPFADAVGSSASGITIDPTGSFVYVTNWEANIAGYRIDAFSGALTAIAGSPFTAPSYTGWGWQSLAINPAGTFAYAGSGNGGQWMNFSIDPSSGALTSVPANSYGDPGWNYATFNSTGSQAFVSNAWALTMAIVNVDPLTGAVTDIPGSPFFVGIRPFDIAVVQP